MYEECNLPEAVWDGGRKKEDVFSVSMTNLRNSSFTLHRADSWTRRKGIYPRHNLEKKDFNPGLITVPLVCFPPLQMGFYSKPYLHILGHTKVVIMKIIFVIFRISCATFQTSSKKYLRNTWLMDHLIVWDRIFLRGDSGSNRSRCPGNTSHPLLDYYHHPFPHYGIPQEHHWNKMALALSTTERMLMGNFYFRSNLR